MRNLDKQVIKWESIENKKYNIVFHNLICEMKNHIIEMSISDNIQTPSSVAKTIFNYKSQFFRNTNFYLSLFKKSHIQNKIMDGKSQIDWYGAELHNIPYFISTEELKKILIADFNKRRKDNEKSYVYFAYLINNIDRMDYDFSSIKKQMKIIIKESGM